MSTRPSDVEFFKWVRNDQNKSKVQNALRECPDLITIKGSVSCNKLNFLIIITF